MNDEEIITVPASTNAGSGSSAMRMRGSHGRGVVFGARRVHIQDVRTQRKFSLP